MTAPFCYPDFSEPPPGEARIAHCDGASDGGLDRLIRQRDEALDTLAKVLDALHAYPKPNEAIGVAAAHAKTTLAKAGRPYASAATRHTALDAGFHSSVGV